jgi:hypothetical protein
LPTEKEDVKIRKQIFKVMQDNGNGLLSLLETREGMRKILSS